MTSCLKDGLTNVQVKGTDGHTAQISLHSLNTAKLIQKFPKFSLQKIQNQY